MVLGYSICSCMILLLGLCVLRVRIIALLYSYCMCISPVKVTKSTSVHPAAADGADESLGFYFFERGGGGGGGVVEMESRHRDGNTNKLQPLGFHHPPSPLLCICLHPSVNFVIYPVIFYYYHVFISGPIPFLPALEMLPVAHKVRDVGALV